MKYKIKSTKTAHSGFLNVKRIEVEYDCFEPGRTISATREILERNDAVAIILFEKDSDSILLTKQFRFPASAKDKQSGYEDAGWLLEIPAGVIDENEKPEDAVRREVDEELGYRVGEMELITIFYPSPAVSTERIFLYYAEINSSDKISGGGGVKDENEDIQGYKLPVSLIPGVIKDRRIHDAKSIVGLQWFLMNRGQVKGI